MTPDRPARFQDLQPAVDAVIDRVGRRLVVGLPIGIGKPNHWVNALYETAKADPSLTLEIFTGLTLETPEPSSELERRLMEPILERVFPDYPNLAYARDLRRGELPDNVRVVSFFFSPGSRLGSPQAQQDYVSSNYTHVARDMKARGMNVLGQALAKRGEGEEARYSLSGNPDVTLDLLEWMARRRDAGEPVAAVGQVNRRLPFMVHDAEVPASDFDLVIDDPRFDHEPFGPPEEPVSTGDWAMGLAASALVPDGGTVQIGIGSLGDAIVGGLCLRHESPSVYGRVLDTLGLPQASGELIDSVGGTEPFEQGLYAASEMLVDGLLYLYKRGILKRRVYPHEGLQRLLNEGEIGEEVGPDTLEALWAAGELPARVRERDLATWKDLGVFADDLTWHDGRLVTGDGAEIAPDLDDASVRRELAAKALGSRLRGGVVAHSGFFLGPGKFYETLRRLSEEERRDLVMTSVSRVNQLYGNCELRTLQRKDARFLNSAFMMTLLGAAVSDGFDDGRVLSGVGGQYNFVAMGHALPGGRSILLVRSVREKGDDVTSNLVWSYGHVTIPRHLRDVVITEYGVADLRGKTDAEVIAALLNVADSRFQDELMRRAKEAGKLPRDHRIPDRHRHNVPQRLEEALAPFRDEGRFPEYPQGTDLTPVEQVLARALKKLKDKAGSARVPLPGWSAARKIWSVPAAARPYLERLELDQPRSLQEKVMQAQVVWALALDGVV